MLVTEPGTAVTGADVRTAMQAMVDRGVPLTMTARHLYVNEDHGVALVIADWTMRGTASDGEEVDQSGSASDVLMLINGEWRCVIDNPIGSAQ